MANEMLGIVVIITLVVLNICVFLARFTHTKAKILKMPLFLNLAFMCFIAGYLMLYFSPGHHLRASYTSAYMSLSDIWKLNMGAKMEHILHTLINFTSPILLVLGAFLSVALVAMLNQMRDFKFESHYNSRREFYLALILLFVAYCLCALSTIQFNPLPHRARLGDSLIVIAMIALVWDRFANFRALQKGAIALCALYAVFVGSAFVEYRIKWNAMVSEVEQSKARGEEEVEVDYIFYSFYENLIDWSQPTKNANAFPNPHYAKYFGVDSFAVK